MITLPRSVLAMIEHLTAENIRLERELAECQRDAERLNFLESLCHRTDPNKKPEVNSIGSDMHFRRGNATLYIRNCTANVVNSGFGTVREAIDAALAKVGAGKGEE